MGKKVELKLGEALPMPGALDLKSNIFGVSYETFLRDCPHCKNAIPLSGPITQVQCPECRSEVAVPEELWDAIHKRVYLDWLLSTKFDGVEEQIEIPAPRFKLEVRRVLHEAPPCIHCGAPAPKESFSASTDCGGCNTPIRYVPLEKSFDGMEVTHVCATELDAAPGEATPVEPPDGETAPVAMACPLCSANLQVTPDSPRTISCDYCDGSIYLPDDLWRRFHPVKTAQHWATAHRATAAAFRGKARWIGFGVPLTLLALFLIIGGPVLYCTIKTSPSAHDREVATNMVWVFPTIIGVLWVFFLLRARVFFAAARRFQQR